MSAGTVVVLADGDADQRAARDLVLDRLPGAVAIAPAPGPEHASAARWCLGIATADPDPPLTIVAFGDVTLLLPAIALAQRAAHRRVIEYVLVDPRLPDVTDSWPDARVTVFTDREGGPERLRGWPVRERQAIAEWIPEE